MITARRFRRLSIPAALVSLALALAVLPGSGLSLSGFGCPGGYHPATGEERQTSLDRLATGLDAGPMCVSNKHPEPVDELMAMAAQRNAMASAPTGYVEAGAFTRALQQRLRVLRQGQSPENDNRWAPAGNGVLQSGDEGYGSVNGDGLVEVAGRITSFAYVPKSDRYLPDTVLASASNGGIWMTDANVSRWVSIGDGLPTQVVGAVGYSPYGGGTIIALTGDGSFGSDSREGAGAFYTTDAGRHWAHSEGIPDSAFGFKLATDKAHPNVVYAATGAGLFRSINGGRSFANVKLPTSAQCAGKSNRVRPCLLANMVTDVVVMTPGGATDEKGSKVVAAVGWRGGNVANPDGTIQAPGNGLYTSDGGGIGTFTKIDPVGFVSQDRIGRIEMGAAEGPDQDHNYLYALVQDAVLIRHGLPAIDAPAGDQVAKLCPTASGTVGVGVPCGISTILKGIYVSPDFGQTWVLMADASELANPGSGSALAAQAALGYGPGVQSWYNMWIKPDPTLATPDGTPTRLLFGLEEVWQNENTNVPQNGPSAFHVIGRYRSGNTCLSIITAPACPTNRDEAIIPTTTTHPDQHDAIFLPRSDGGVRLIVSNDGGAYSQVAPPGFDFSNANWGIGANRGFNTLLPYDAARAKDGTIWLGLQDNGTAKIVDIRKNGRLVERGRTIETYGGDGFFVAVDPDNSNRAYEEYVYGDMSATVDGGHTWSSMSPPITNAHFSNPFVLDPLDADHLMIAGRQVVETGSGPGTSSEDWATVFNLGTARHPGSSSAIDGPTDAANSMTAIDLYGPAAYVGFCGTCDVLNSTLPFKNGIATNVGGSKSPRRYSSQGWHIARAAGLPNRYITGVALDHTRPSTVYVSLGGYQRPWTPPGMLDKNARARGGHIYVSYDSGEHFRDISGNLPDIPVNWITLRGDQVIAATDVGVFASDPNVDCDNPGISSCNNFELLGRGLPGAPVYTVRLAPGDSNLLVAAVYGRGVWTYRFGPTPPSEETVTRKLPTPRFLGKTIAAFGFETDAMGWRTRTNNDAEEWKLMPPGNASSQAFAVTPYTDESTATLISPRMRLPARSKVKLSWFERTDTEECCDFLTVDWSSDGYVWHSIHGKAGQNADFPNFSPASVSFVAPAGDLYVRFRLSSDALVSFPPYSGVALDDIKLER